MFRCKQICFYFGISIVLFTLPWFLIKAPMLESAYFSALSSVSNSFIVFIAGLGLFNWKSQETYKRKLQFLDDLIFSLIQYKDSIESCIQALEFIKIDINNHTDFSSDKYKALTEYIDNGKRIASLSRLQEYLNFAEPHASRIRTVLIKGIILKTCYPKIDIFCKNILYSYQQINAFSTFMNIRSLYWENPEVQKNVEQIMRIDPELIRKTIDQNFEDLLNYIEQIKF